MVLQPRDHNLTKVRMNEVEDRSAYQIFRRRCAKHLHGGWIDIQQLPAPMNSDGFGRPLDQRAVAFLARAQRRIRLLPLRDVALDGKKSDDGVSVVQDRAHRRLDVQEPTVLLAITELAFDRLAAQQSLPQCGVRLGRSCAALQHPGCGVPDDLGGGIAVQALEPGIYEREQTLAVGHEDDLAGFLNRLPQPRELRPIVVRRTVHHQSHPLCPTLKDIGR